MANLKDLKTRINSVKSTRKITQAMQMVAASKLKRAEEAAENARPYAERMEAVLANLTRASKGRSGPKLLSGTGQDQTHLLIVATAERGLCGGFNSSIAKIARQRAEELQANGKTVKILTIGRKGRDALRRNWSDLFVGHVDHSDVKRLGFENADRVGADVIKRFNEGEFDVATIFFSRFETVISQVPTALQLIPAEVPENDEARTGGTNYEYEPDEDEILTELLPRNVAIQIFRALLENAASEQGARMSAMDNATRNAGDMIERLEIVYNRTRQAAITTELIEIISGAEAL